MTSITVIRARPSATHSHTEPEIIAPPLYSTLHTAAKPTHTKINVPGKYFIWPWFVETKTPVLFALVWLAVLKCHLAFLLGFSATRLDMLY